ALPRGCFPLERDVNKDGQILIARQEGFFPYDPATGKVKKLRGAEGAKPVFARFAPGGKEFLAVSKVKAGFGEEFVFVVAPLDGGAGREVFRGKDCAYVRYSPDGTRLAIARVSQDPHPRFKDRMPELHLVGVKDGARKQLPQPFGVLFRWFGDSKRLLAVEITDKDKSGNFHGNLATIDVASGKLTPHAAVVVTTQFFFDLSPDNQGVLFTALRPGKPGADPAKGNGVGMKLFELDLSTGAVRNTKREARYAIYSPSGKRVLLGTPPEGFSLDRLKLEVADAADLGKSTVVVEDAHMPLAIGGEGIVFPGW